MVQARNDTLVGYVSDPNGRGTSSLVLSCLLTLILCAWSALHLNVPAQGQTRRQLVWLNIRWIIAGIYSPELVVFSAWRQWSSARLLSKTIDTLYNRGDGGQISTSKRHRWTITHSVFASTGGFAIDCEPYINGLKNSNGFLAENTPKRLTVSARGIEFLAKRGALPDVSKADIEDKSKSDALGKTLVLTQALWFLAQVIARPIAGLPVTLLEINTVAHVLCTLLLYILWWSKPYLPQEPIIINSSVVIELLPLMFMSSEISCRQSKEQLQSGTSMKTFLTSLGWYSKEPEIVCICSRSQTRQGPLQVNEVEYEHNRSKEGGEDVEIGPFTYSLVDDECAKLIEDERIKQANTTMFLERRPRVYNDIRSIHHDDTFQRRIARLDSLLQDDNAISTESFRHQLQDGRVCRHFQGIELLCEHSRNWPYGELLQSVNGLVIGIILWTANLTYGAIHATAWHDRFPSVVEKWLWRSSAVYISFAGGLWVIINVLLKKSPAVDEFFLNWVTGQKYVLHYVWLGTIVTICGCSLIFARIYLVVGAFLSVRSLPQSAYDTPNWSQVFPHF